MNCPAFLCAHLHVTRGLKMHNNRQSLCDVLVNNACFPRQTSCVEVFLTQICTTEKRLERLTSAFDSLGRTRHGSFWPSCNSRWIRNGYLKLERCMCCACVYTLIKINRVLPRHRVLSKQHIVRSRLLLVERRIKFFFFLTKIHFQFPIDKKRKIENRLRLDIAEGISRLIFEWHVVLWSVRDIKILLAVSLVNSVDFCEFYLPNEEPMS